MTFGLFIGAKKHCRVSSNLFANLCLLIAHKTTAKGKKIVH